MGLMDIRRRILADAPQLATATGAVASFSTDMAVPLKKCEFAIEPVQSGTGDPSPSNVRPISGWTGVNGYHAKKNLLPASIPSNIITADFNSTEITSAANARTFAIPVPPNTDIYVQKKNGNTNGHNLALGDTGNIAVGTPVYEMTGFSNLIRKQYNTGNHTWLYIKSSSQTVAEEIFTTSEFMVSVGTTRQEYVAPYTGEQIAVTFPAQGKNLLDTTSWVEGKYIGAKGKIGNDSGNHYSENFSPIKAGTYTISIKRSPSVSALVRLHGYNSQREWVQQVYTENLNAGDSTYSTQITIGTGIDYLRISITDSTSNIQLEAGSIATSYEPYTNTVYGGTLNVTTGVLTVDKAKIVLNGTETWTSSGGLYTSVSTLAKLQDYSNAIYADKLNTAVYQTSMPANSITGYKDTSGRYPNNNWIYARVDGVTTVADISAWLAQNPLEVVYQLATPKTYQLTPQQITAIKGQNNVWCNTGNTTVKYWRH